MTACPCAGRFFDISCQGGNQRQVIAACRQWFRLPANDARLEVVNDDAGRWVQDDSRLQTVDVLNVDVYDHDAASPVLDDEAFYAAILKVWLGDTPVDADLKKSLLDL